jgi:hypothetical protein
VQEPVKKEKRKFDEKDYQVPEKIQDKDLQEALKVAQMAEKAEEEEMMRRAIEESQKMEEEQK